MKRLWTIVVSIVFFVIFVVGSPVMINASEESECFTCHSSAKKLIDATREIAESKPAVKASQSEGEG